MDSSPSRTLWFRFCERRVESFLLGWLPGERRRVVVEDRRLENNDDDKKKGAAGVGGVSSCVHEFHEEFSTTGVSEAG